MVAGPNSEVLLQPNGSSPQDGQFCVQGLNSELFEVNHTVRPCLPTRVNCNQDQVWISKRDVFSNQSGSFSVTYTGAETISTQVFYGMYFNYEYSYNYSNIISLSILYC